MKPVQTYRAGSIAAKIWENQVIKKDGSTAVFHTISLDRSYQDANATWQSTNSLRATDIPKAILVLNKAYERLVLKRQENTMTTALATETGTIPVFA